MSLPEFYNLEILTNDTYLVDRSHTYSERIINVILKPSYNTLKEISVNDFNCLNDPNLIYFTIVDRFIMSKVVCYSTGSTIDVQSLSKLWYILVHLGKWYVTYLNDIVMIVHRQTNEILSKNLSKIKSRKLNQYEEIYNLSEREGDFFSKLVTFTNTLFSKACATAVNNTIIISLLRELIDNPTNTSEQNVFVMLLWFLCVDYQLDSLYYLSSMYRVSSYQPHYYDQQPYELMINKINMDKDFETIINGFDVFPDNSLPFASFFPIIITEVQLKNVHNKIVDTYFIKPYDDNFNVVTSTGNADINKNDIFTKINQIYDSIKKFNDESNITFFWFYYHVNEISQLTIKPIETLLQSTTDYIKTQLRKTLDTIVTIYISCITCSNIFNSALLLDNPNVTDIFTFKDFGDELSNMLGSLFEVLCKESNNDANFKFVSKLIIHLIKLICAITPVQCDKTKLESFFGDIRQWMNLKNDLDPDEMVSLPNEENEDEIESQATVMLQKPNNDDENKSQTDVTPQNFNDMDSLHNEEDEDEIKSQATVTMHNPNNEEDDNEEDDNEEGDIMYINIFTKEMQNTLNDILKIDFEVNNINTVKQAVFYFEAVINVYCTINRNLKKKLKMIDDFKLKLDNDQMQQQITLLTAATTKINQFITLQSSL